MWIFLALGAVFLIAAAILLTGGGSSLVAGFVSHIEEEGPRIAMQKRLMRAIGIYVLVVALCIVTLTLSIWYMWVLVAVPVAVIVATVALLSWFNGQLQSPGIDGDEERVGVVKIVPDNPPEESQPHPESGEEAAEQAGSANP